MSPSKTDTTQNLIVSLLVLSAAAILTTEARLWGFLSMQESVTAITVLGVAHVLIASAWLIRERRGLPLAYLALTMVGFFIIGAVTPIGLAWMLTKVLFRTL